MPRFNFKGLPSLFIDNQPYRLDFLETMQPLEVESLSLLNAADATFRWGLGYQNGAILIETRRR